MLSLPRLLLKVGARRTIFPEFPEFFLPSSLPEGLRERPYVLLDPFLGNSGIPSRRVNCDERHSVEPLWSTSRWRFGNLDDCWLGNFYKLARSLQARVFFRLESISRAFQELRWKFLKTRAQFNDAILARVFYQTSLWREIWIILKTIITHNAIWRACILKAVEGKSFKILRASGKNFNN